VGRARFGEPAILLHYLIYPQKRARKPIEAGVSHQAGLSFMTAEKMRILNEFRAFAAVGGDTRTPYPGNYLNEATVTMQESTLLGAAHPRAKGR